MKAEPAERTRTITWDDTFTIPRAAVGKTGRGILTELFGGRLPPPPIATTMGFIGVEVAEGRAVFEGDAAEYLYNPIGVVHGGFAMTLLDSAMGGGVQT